MTWEECQLFRICSNSKAWVKKTTAPVRKKAKHGQPKKTRPLNMASLTWKQQNWDEISRFSDREITFHVSLIEKLRLQYMYCPAMLCLSEVSPLSQICWMPPLGWTAGFSLLKSLLKNQIVWSYGIQKFTRERNNDTQFVIHQKHHKRDAASVLCWR